MTGIQRFAPKRVGVYCSECGFAAELTSFMATGCLSGTIVMIIAIGKTLIVAQAGRLLYVIRTRLVTSWNRPLQVCIEK